MFDRIGRIADETPFVVEWFVRNGMVVNQLIRRVDVYRGYQINISFNFDLTPYIEGK